MRSYLIVFVVATVTVFSTQAGAQQRGPSTPEERARAVQTAKSLQSDPLAPNVQEDREWLVKWLIEVPDISVKMCTTFFGDLGDSKNGYPGEFRPCRNKRRYCRWLENGVKPTTGLERGEGGDRASASNSGGLVRLRLLRVIFSAQFPCSRRFGS